MTPQMPIHISILLPACCPIHCLHPLTHRTIYQRRSMADKALQSVLGRSRLLLSHRAGLNRTPIRCLSVRSGREDMPPFHVAFPVRDIQEARDFYGGLLGCSEGRSAKTWVDFNLYGHQIVAHLVEKYDASTTANAVDGDPVPVPHFGLALSVQQFHDLSDRLQSSAVKFEIEPHVRFEGKPGEQWTMFFRDPSGNPLEFKAMTNPENLFAKYVVDS